MDSKRVVICVVIILMIVCGCEEDGKKMTRLKPRPTGQSAKNFETKITKTVKCGYLLFIPQGYNERKEPWPLIMFLHGAGERGEDLALVKYHGPAKIVEEKKDFEFIVVSPQCPKSSWWPKELEVLTNLLDEICRNYNVDRERIYLTGLSMGGYGTWSLACEHPERFAAIAPICGGGEPLLGVRLKTLPVWAFHGGKDQLVPPAKSEEMVKAVTDAGGDAKLTVYPEAGHDSWTQTYNNPELYEWFLKHRRIIKAK